MIAVDAAAYDPRPQDEARFERAIARRNTAYSHHVAAQQMLTAAVRRGLDLPAYRRNANEAQREYERSIYDLVRERRRFQLARAPIAD